MRYVAALLAVICLLGAAAAGLFACVTTERFALAAGSRPELLSMQQQRIDAAAAALNEEWQLAPDVLGMWTAEAARQQSEAAAAWWGALWQDEAADAALPMWLDADEEAILVADVRRDDGFRALTPESRRKAIARDDVVYTLDKAVCDAVTPLRRSILEAALDLARTEVSLPGLRRAVITAGCALAGLAAALLLLARRMAGSALVSAGVVMALAALPVWLADVPGLLMQLNGVAALQGRSLLGLAARMWLGAAAALAALGLVILGLKRLFRRKKA